MSPVMNTASMKLSFKQYILMKAGIYNGKENIS